VWANGQLTLLGTLGGTVNGAQDINASGQIVGYSETTEEGIWHAMLWDAGGTRDLGTLGGACSEAFGISNAGWVVGESDTPQNQIHAFLWRDGTMLDLGVEGYAQAVNDAGQIVGNAFAPAPFPYHPFLWDNGTLYDLNDLLAGTGYFLTDVGDINNAGQIVATGMFNGEWKGLLLSPIPEPGTGLLLLGGVCIASYVRRREANNRGGHRPAREELRLASRPADGPRKLPT
jgi:probable HAF family extracellular repeat protein